MSYICKYDLDYLMWCKRPQNENPQTESGVKSVFCIWRMQRCLHDSEKLYQF